ncbi:glycosyltransferase family 2 protein [Jannaschia sp. CCS1]|uniref:glycosyltransferase family 2 protein n=1 Tax=Jannaschia sp. (strain CCS1) TaxID=290400 RepID=UPI000053D3C7|nr:glycosyltransferase family 2 protein [Jannaschia sp. CCS1]ABD53753.1 hypothetical protein Jann_0836 [Jannaschia sp. CCS1]
MAQKAVVACMRNEAIFLLEWIAYQLVIGFDLVAVVTNDCTDGTDRILDRLAEFDDRIIHIRNEIGEGESPQLAGMRHALNHPRIAEAEYLLHCDADEFLHVSRGAGRVDDLLAHTKGADCIALSWRPFGDAGIEKWPGGSVIAQCTMADAKLRLHTALHKCMFRPDRFGYAIDHMPKDPVADDITMVNARGDAIPAHDLFRASSSRFRNIDPGLYSWDVACIHHYAIRAKDVFLMKNVRGDGMAMPSEKYFVNSSFWRRYNRNQVEVPEAQQHLWAVTRITQELRALSNRIKRVERDALAAYFEARDTILDAEQVAKWTA